MPMITGKSRQLAVRFKSDVYSLLEEDSGEKGQVSPVVNHIVEKHYAKRLKNLRSKNGRKRHTDNTVPKAKNDARGQVEETPLRP